MNVLVCGSTGCVGTAVCAALEWRGHRVVRGSRSAATLGEDPSDAVRVDFLDRVEPQTWARRLVAWRIDAVVNAVGILVQTPAGSFERVHRDAPIELFEGARRAGVRRIVQVSALGAGSAAAPPGGGTSYLHGKRVADEALLALDVDGAVVRPSLVFGPRSASARLFATLASLPVIGLPGRGDQLLQPIHVLELAEAIAALVDRSGAARGVYELGGGGIVRYREMLATYRTALGLGPAIWLPTPMPLLRLAARAAAALPQRVFSADTVALLAAGNVPSRNAAPVLLGRTPSSLADGLAVTAPAPAFSTVVALPPALEWPLRGALAFLWLYTAAISALLPVDSGVLALLERCGFGGRSGHAALVASCLLNAALGSWTLLRPSVWLYALQLGAIGGYTVVAALRMPELTLDHCGPLAKNVPLAGVVLVLWLAEASRRSPRRTAGGQTSMLATLRALLSMKLRRGSTSSPISMVKTRSASMASSS